jgi:adenine-specific DNA-methyltransferase
VARKRVDARDASTRSAFNSKRTMPAALASVVQSVDCDLLVLSYNNEAWLDLEELEEMCSIQNPAADGTKRAGGSSRARRREVATLAFDSTRYVGARIGIFNPSGRKVGRVSHLSNQELLVIAGDPALVRRVVEAVGSTPLGSAPDAGVGTGRSGGVGAAMVDRLQQAT